MHAKDAAAGKERDGRNPWVKCGLQGFHGYFYTPSVVFGFLFGFFWDFFDPVIQFSASHFISSLALKENQGCPLPGKNDKPRCQLPGSQAKDPEGHQRVKQREILYF